MDKIDLVRKTYTQRHSTYESEEGWKLIRETRAWKATAVPLDDLGETWDVWLQAKSERQLSALMAKLPSSLVWTKLDCEAYTVVPTLRVFDILDRLGYTKRKVLTGKDKLIALERLNKPKLELVKN